MFRVITQLHKFVIQLNVCYVFTITVLPPDGQTCLIMSIHSPLLDTNV